MMSPYGSSKLKMQALNDQNQPAIQLNFSLMARRLNHRTTQLKNTQSGWMLEVSAAMSCLNILHCLRCIPISMSGFGIKPMYHCSLISLQTSFFPLPVFAH